MELLSGSGWAGGTLFLALSVLWVISLRIRDAGIVDAFWGLGFAMVLWLGLAMRTGPWPGRLWLLAALLSIWALRLSLHIGIRNAGQPEDFRYRAWREKHGNRWWWRSLFQVFLLQGLILWVVAWPLMAAVRSDSPAPLDLFDAPALTLWLTGFVFEAVGDFQMQRFRADEGNRGQVMDRGLWHYTRHPNYFGDALQHWAFWLLALRAEAWWTVFAPALMTFLLLRISGVSLLEKSLSKRKSRYDEYRARTPAFFPWWPKP